GAQKIPAHERQLRSASAIARPAQWQRKKDNDGAPRPSGYGCLGSRNRRSADPAQNRFRFYFEQGVGIVSPQRFAFFDIGTNTILCLIAELDGTGRFTVLDDLAEIARLGEGVDRSGRISAEGEQRSAEILKSYLKRCADLRVGEVL